MHSEVGHRPPGFPAAFLRGLGHLFLLTRLMPQSQTGPKLQDFRHLDTCLSNDSPELQFWAKSRPIELVFPEKQEHKFEPKELLRPILIPHH